MVIRRFAAAALAAAMLCAATAFADLGGLFADLRERAGAPPGIGVLASGDGLWDFEDDILVSSVIWDELALDSASAEKYPGLDAALEYLNIERRLYCERAAEELSAIVRDTYDMYGIWESCSEAVECYVQRADSRVLSYRAQTECFWGDEPDGCWTEGVNLDTETGRRLTLGDVAGDRDGLVRLAAEKLAQEHDDIPFADPVEAVAAFSDEKLQWTLDNDGITFYFDPFVVLPYPDGDTSVKVFFSEAEELFRPGYLPGPGFRPYSADIPLFREIRLDLDPGDGSYDRFELLARMGDYGAYEQLVIGVNGAENMFDTYAYSLSACLVTAGTESAPRNLVYIESVGDSDYRTLSVFDLTADGAVMLGEMFGVGFASALCEGVYVLSDPSEFPLDTRLDILGTRFGTRIYSVDPDTGMPEPFEEAYAVESGGDPLVSLRPLEALMLDTGETEIIPTGTWFHELRTDGETYMDFRLNDGRECRIEVDTSAYPHVIDGVPEEECFDGIIYAA